LKSSGWLAFVSDFSIGIWIECLHRNWEIVHVAAVRVTLTYSHFFVVSLINPSELGLVPPSELGGRSCAAVLNVVEQTFCSLINSSEIGIGSSIGIGRTFMCCGT
jgi:hypothetical protein